MIKNLLSPLLLFVFFGATSSSYYSQQSYYNGIDFTKNGIALKNDLAIKIIKTHTNFLSYTPGVWEASKITDVNPNNSFQVLLIYGYSSTGITSRTRGIDDNGGENGDWNREHTYPRSLGNPNLGSIGPGSDAHHLRPSDVQFNSQRGNKKFTDGSGNSREISGNWYPGDEWKGDIARMMMYMYLRYGDQCLPSAVGTGSSANTPDDMIDLFLKWNAEDPVSAIENTRNNYHGNTNNTYAQGNRNPFIDNPFLASKIWGNPPSGTKQAEDRWGTLNTNSSESIQFSFYPNPADGNSLFCKSKNAISVQIISILGKQLIHQKLENTSSQIDISTLKPGIYLVKISSDEKTITKKLIKK